MKPRVLGMLLGTFVLLWIASCATVPTEPLEPGEVRLLKLRFAEVGVIKANLQYVADIDFESEGRPEIKRVCFAWTKRGTGCFKVDKVNYGSPGTIGVTVRTAEPGYFFMDTFVIYDRNGKSVRSNAITTQVDVAN